MELATTILAIVGAVYACVRAIIAAVKTPVVFSTGQVDETKMKKEHPIVNLLAALFAIDPAKGNTTEKNVRLKPPAGTLIILMLLGLGMTGCEATRTAFNPWSTTTSNQPANVTEMDADGLQRGVYQGIGATNFKADSDGIYAMTPGNGSIISKDGVCIYLPGDMTAEEIEYDGAVFTAKKLTISYSKPLKVQGEAVAVAFAEISKMTQTEAEKEIARMVMAKEITLGLADALLKYFVPTLPTGLLP